MASRTEMVDRGFGELLAELERGPQPSALAPDAPVGSGTALTAAQALELFESQATSRHLDYAARALRAVDGQGARRLAMMADEGELAAIGRTPQLMGVIQRFGNRGMDLIWRNKGVLVGAAVVSAFVANPEPYIDGTLKLADVVAEKAAGPLAERAVDRANWTLLFGVAGALGVAWVAIRFRGLRRRISRSA